MTETTQTLAPLDYVPVGTMYSEEQINNLSLDRLAARSIYDPRFEGFEANFDWRNYVAVDMIDPELRRQTEASLDQFSQTPEGQHLMRQSLAQETFRNTGAVGVNADKSQEHRVVIVDYTTQSDGTRLPYSGRSQWDKGTIHINPARLNSEYLGEDGQYHNCTVQDFLFHELGHSADGFLNPTHEALFRNSHASGLIQETRDIHNTRSRLINNGASAEAITHYDNASRIRLYEQNDLFIGSAFEYSVMRAASEFMAVHYGDAPQAISYLQSPRPDPDEGPHFHETIVASPLRTPTKSAPSRDDASLQR